MAPRTGVGNQGAQSTFGGSLATLLRVTENFDATLRVMFQNTADHGFPATFAPLPGFTPDYTLNRAYDVQPHASDVWALPSLDLKYTGQGWSFVSSSSFFYRHTRDVEDSTYGTQQVLTDFYDVKCLPNQPFLWDGEHFHDQITEEMRLSFDPWHNLSGTMGAFYSQTHTKFYIPPTYATGLTAATVPSDAGPVQAWPNDEIWTQTNPAVQKDKSLFGELYYKFFDKYTLTVGARQYWLSQEADYTADGFMNSGPTPSNPQHNSQSGIDPKAGLSYQVTEDTMVYGSASKGFRAGGALRDLGIQAGSRILGTPAWNASVGAVYTQPLTASIDGFVSADYSYTGDSVALLNGGYGVESTRPSYSLVNLRIGIDHEKSEFSLNIHNLTNAKPNLGDIGYVGYAQYQNYAAGTIIPQVATLQPLTVLLQYKQSF